jgi:hypothetical protein
VHLEINHGLGQKNTATPEDIDMLLKVGVFAPEFTLDTDRYAA